METASKAKGQERTGHVFSLLQIHYWERTNASNPAKVLVPELPFGTRKELTSKRDRQSGWSKESPPEAIPFLGSEPKSRPQQCEYPLKSQPTQGDERGDTERSSKEQRILKRRQQFVEGPECARAIKILGVQVIEGWGGQRAAILLVIQTVPIENHFLVSQVEVQNLLDFAVKLASKEDQFPSRKQNTAEPWLTPEETVSLAGKVGFLRAILGNVWLGGESLQRCAEASNWWNAPAEDDVVSVAVPAEVWQADGADFSFLRKNLPTVQILLLKHFPGAAPVL